MAKGRTEQNDVHLQCLFPSIAMTSSIARGSSRHSLLRWAGSKKMLLPVMLSHAPPGIQCYFEPFLGSGQFFFFLKPKKAVLGDINKDLVHTFMAIKENADEVIGHLNKYNPTSDVYYQTRNQQVTVQDPASNAARFIFLNRYCYNGVYRTNHKGQFNVPFGRKTGSMPPVDVFRDASESLKIASLITGDFQTTIESAKKGDFVYLDPPYVHDIKRHRGEYGKNSFGIKDVPRLNDSLDDMDRNGVKFLLSYAENIEVKKAMKKWNVTVVNTRRNVAPEAKQRLPVHEILVRNYL